MSTLFQYKENTTRPEQLLPFYIYELHTKGDSLHVPLHWHSELEIIIPYTDGFLEVDGVKHLFNKGDILFVNCDQLHTTFIYTEGTIFHLVFTPDLFALSHSTLYFDSLFDKLVNGDLLFPNHIPAIDPLNSQLMPLLQNILHTTGSADISEHLLISANYHLLISILYKNNAFLTCTTSAHPTSLLYIKKSIQYMVLHIDEPVNINLLADFLGISSGYFCKIFKAYTSLPPSQYFIDLKLEHACRLLVAGQSTTSTAQQVGIPNVSHFIRLFKKKYGVTPNKYTSTL